ncbi:alkyl sulfatase dimerization domain-containing protein [Streptomyces atroolivaceus]|uniref:alkyl sulfatase dimerization domain-containing protein n=1 Tax=Streptomyces atroolivaceus TaxID=66869 RepID=UPI0036CD53B1
MVAAHAQVFAGGAGAGRSARACSGADSYPAGGPGSASRLTRSRTRRPRRRRPPTPARSGRRPQLRARRPTPLAEELRFPPALERAWRVHGYYGSLSQNAKAVYQRYMGWFDGNPAHLWQHPPCEAAERYATFMGGANAVVDKARASFEAGDLRWTAEVLGQPEHADARTLQASAFERLGNGRSAARGATSTSWAPRSYVTAYSAPPPEEPPTSLPR